MAKIRKLAVAATAAMLAQTATQAPKQGKDPDAKKQARIRKIMDDAAKLLEAEGVKYFIGVVDKDPKREDGGKAYAQSDVTGEDFTHILDMALPTRQDVINLGIWVGQLIHARAKNPLG